MSSQPVADEQSFSFPLVLSGDAELVISYVEPGLAQRSINKDLGPLNFAAPGGDGTSTLFFLIVLVVIGYFVWRRYFRKKKKRD